MKCHHVKLKDFGDQNFVIFDDILVMFGDVGHVMTLSNQFAEVNM